MSSESNGAGAGENRSFPLFKSIARFSALVILLLGLWSLARQYTITIEAIKTYITAYPPLIAAFVYASIYIFVSVAPTPARDLVKLVGALIWGILASSAILWIAEILTAIISFWLSRLMGKAFIDRIIGNRASSLQDRLRHAGIKTIVFLRLLPIVPWRYLNFGAGLVDLKFSDYLIGSIIGIIPRTLLVQYLFVELGDRFLSDKTNSLYLLLFSVLFTMTVLIGWGILYRTRSRLLGSHHRPRDQRSPK